jgi:iron complex transport system substrate-binding protein
MPWNGSWYLSGTASFQAQLLKDAGAQYLWLGNDEKSSLIKSKEIIIDEAYDADYWLNQNSYSDIASIIKYDDKFKGFKAVKQKKLYNNDNRINVALGNDYWESGVVNPQVILKDLIKVFHPELIKHEMYYYRKLK